VEAAERVVEVVVLVVGADVIVFKGAAGVAVVLDLFPIEISLSKNDYFIELL
jgi:hypothetical protein